MPCGNYPYLCSLRNYFLLLSSRLFCHRSLPTGDSLDNFLYLFIFKLFSFLETFTMSFLIGMSLCYRSNEQIMEERLAI